MLLASVQFCKPAVSFVAYWTVVDLEVSPTRVTVTVANPADSLTLEAALLNCNVASSFAIVMFTVGDKLKLTLVALLKLKVNVSSGSIVVSPVIGILIVPDADLAEGFA